MRAYYVPTTMLNVTLFEIYTVIISQGMKRCLESVSSLPNITRVRGDQILTQGVTFHTVNDTTSQE